MNELLKIDVLTRNISKLTPIGSKNLVNASISAYAAVGVG
jgi:hypothetical protein